MLSGRTTSNGKAWTFRCPALTCAATPLVSAWLREGANWIDREATGEHLQLPPPLTFTEPDLAFRLISAPDDALLALQVVLDHEFRRRGTAFRKRLRTSCV